MNNTAIINPKTRSSTHPAFDRIRSQPIDSLNLTVEEYRHRKTGAKHFHLATDNPENVFLVAFPTVPTDSTGVAHILEHTVLCGSRNYPVRDPFFMMLRRSLNTFMNAFTSADWTAYPFASKNKKDFSNLLKIYLDAAFFARLHPLDFAQEGHRVEFENPTDPETDLVFKGVVFNEMKGAMSSPVATLWQTLSSHLFPTTTYHYNSGGDPERIPDLSHEQLKSFYQTHYHPSNAVFMTFGDIPAQEHHQAFESQALSEFDRLEMKLNVGDEKRYSAPLRVEESYALETEDAANKTHIVLGWLLGRSTDLEEQLKAHLLSGVLLDNSASPLRHALETCGLGAAPSPLCGLEDNNREMSFICGLEGTQPEHAEALEQRVLEVLREVAEQGVPQEQVEAVLHQLELHQREIGGDGMPYGLQLILEGLSSAIHNGDPVALLNLDPVLEKLRQEIKDPGFIKSLVQENLLGNLHRVRLTLKPDPSLGARRAKAEKARLAALKAAMDEEQKAAVVKLAAELAARQQQPDDPDFLPKVGIEDIPATLSIPQGIPETAGNLPATFFAQGTNGLAYQQIVIDMPHLEDELLEVLPHYTACLTELGVGNRDYRQTQAWQDSISGGINASTTLRGQIDNVQQVNGHFVLSSKALAANHAQLTELLQTTLGEVRFDELDHLREVIAQRRAEWEDQITGSGHALAMAAAASGMSPTAALTHRLTGLAGISLLQQLDESLDSKAARQALADKFRHIHDRLLAAPRQWLLIGEQEYRSEFLAALSQRGSSNSETGTKFTPLRLPEVRASVGQAWTTSTQVNFCAKAYPTVPVGHSDAAALTVLGGFLRNNYLHRAIREQGGAYGGGAGQDSDSAAFRFFSYRDPRLAETLEDFDRSVQWLLENDHEWRLVEEAILGVISAIDKPKSPSGDAKSAFYNSLYGRTPEQRRRFRSQILEVRLEDLKRVAENYLKPENASIAVLTNATQLEQLAGLELVTYKV
ncbi:Peptidase M16-like protein [Nitrosococcus oceani ATCC 19707]|uniref:Peptidase M16-like protein n=2 Tax=Nitrosococcus oceani TaxID=1229 RepID=Q3J9G0_NITOC|nr:insulinase family protein [Nitrosococcus oceani]ABA58536.1 Peptidase M16-like protein [Nitrosococcus oceani ATCC 19707]EDZ68581.1 Peptidase M16C associated family [Nitrosococcus oceani AFC27]KFI19019.1 peptidase M16 [Nitrosococcus oceani C-27]GEM19655.1 peptidase M16 [Nitrosococcus oceani]